jgi:glutathione S-transferase
MKLVGQLDSPFVRRAAVALQFHEIPFEFSKLSVFADFEAILSMSPIGRVPFLILHSGEVLFDSQCIVDYAESVASAERRLLPMQEPDRRRVQGIESVAIAVMEKSVDLRTETIHKITPARDIAWKERLERQIKSGLSWLERLELSPWLNGCHITRADISTAVAFTNLRIKFPGLVPEGEYPRLAQHCESAEATAAFSAAAYPMDPPRQVRGGRS